MLILKNIIPTEAINNMNNFVSHVIALEGKSLMESRSYNKDEILNDFFINESDDDIQNEIEESSIEELNELDNSVSNIDSDETANESYSKDEVNLMIQKEVERIKKETIAEFKANESKEVELPRQLEWLAASKLKRAYIVMRDFLKPKK